MLLLRRLMLSDDYIVYVTDGVQDMLPQIQHLSILNISS